MEVDNNATTETGIFCVSFSLSTINENLHSNTLASPRPHRPAHNHNHNQKRLKISLKLRSTTKPTTSAPEIPHGSLNYIAPQQDTGILIIFRIKCIYICIMLNFI